MRICKSLANKLMFRMTYYPANLDMHSDLPSFRASDITITRTTNYLSRPPEDPKIMTFGAFHTDHMLEIDWNEKKGGWGTPAIVPFKNLEIHPFSACLHYAIECFEGAKAYKTESGQIRMFRLDCNMHRMKKTAHRISLPDFDGTELMHCIQELLKVDSDWIPTHPGFAAYIRPTMIATEETLGVRAPTKAKLFVVISPVGPYFPSGLMPIKIFCNMKHIRAAPGGVGGFKVGGNYAPTIQPQKEVQKQGFSQSLWMLPDGLVQEMGVCNLFFYWKNKNGEHELVTPILDGTILPGVVRDSVITLCTEMKRFKVIERKVYIQEVVEALKEGRMLEMFGTGTAVSIQPIESICYNEEILSVKINPKFNAGDLSHEIFETLSKIQMGNEPHKWITTVDV